MGDLVGSIAGTTIEVLLQNLISICKEEISLIRNFKKDLLKLKESFDMIQAFLNDAEKKQVTDGAVKIWLKNLEAVAFDADNVLDELNYEVLRNKVETGNKLKKKVHRFISARTMARKIREIDEKLELINKRATSYGLQSQLRSHAPSTVGSNILAAERETHSYSIDSIVVGRENYVSEIVDKFTSNGAIHDKFSILPIVGMGGLGKTTLAKLVFNDGKIKTHFDQKLIWIYVSEKFDAKDLFKKILESLIPGEKVDLYAIDTLLKKIQQNLGVQKYLLVLDDVWIEKPDKWDDFIDTLSSISSAKGNGIIVTTRSEKVASIVRTVPFPKLDELPDEDCWSIIKAKSFRKECINPSEFESIGKKIAQRCQGLPLAAKVVGGLLRGKSKEEWISIEETKLSNLGEDGDSIMKILKLSFDNLSSQSLKKCFAFCSIFPKGFEIKKEMLIYLWMAEGFLQSNQENNMENVGDKYFNILLQTSLLQDVWRDDKGNTIGCKMHDLLHDLACSLLHETGPIRYVYMKSDRDILKEEAGNLRSLIFEGKISEDMFSKLKYLRGLVLIGVDNEELPTMEHLKHLRYFNISDTRIKCLPESIGNLYHLQTLQVNNRLEKMPKVLQKLINLRHLHILRSFRDLHESIIEEIPMLGHLPHLKSLYLKFIPNVRSIGSSLDEIHNNGTGKDPMIVFPALERLQLFHMSSLIELLTACEIQFNREIVTFPHLEYLRLYDCKNLTSVPSYVPCLKELDISGSTSLVLENLLVNLTSLTTLTISQIDGLVCLPDLLFFKNQNLSYLKIEGSHNLTHLCPSFGASLRKVFIDYCQNLEELPTNLHCLNSLEELWISNCRNLKSIPFNPSGEGRESVQGFTSLRKLFIYDCHNLTEVPSGMIELCTSLETLALKELPSVINMAAIIGCLGKMPYLTTLEIDLRNIPKLANNFATELGCLYSLHTLTISCRMENWDCVQDQLQLLTALRYLELEYMEIEEVPEWLGKLSCLRHLILHVCPKLTKLPSKEAMKCLTALHVLECPLLNLHNDDDDSEWHKISHIHEVIVVE